MALLQDTEVKDKIVLVRTDYNVPMRDGLIQGDYKLRASLKSIDYLLRHGAKKIILISHLGRPKGQRVPELSLRPIAQRLTRLLGRKVYFVPMVTGDAVAVAVERMPEQGIILLENLRFDYGEEVLDPAFIEELLDDTRADLFVQDGFAVLHRKASSVSLLPKMVEACVGLLVQKEVANLAKIMTAPKHPFVVLVGGAKVKDKAPIIENFKNSADKILVGGKIAADGYAASDKIIVAQDFLEDETGAKLDIGQGSVEIFKKVLGQAKMVFWNGCLGKVEDEAYSRATRAIAVFLGRLEQAEVVIGGGDTVAFVEKLMQDIPSLDYEWLSTGGGASLELLAGKKLPGLVALGYD